MWERDVCRITNDSRQLFHLTTRMNVFRTVTRPETFYLLKVFHKRVKGFSQAFHLPVFQESTKIFEIWEWIDSIAQKIINSNTQRLINFHRIYTKYNILLNSQLLSKNVLSVKLISVNKILVRTLSAKSLLIYENYLLIFKGIFWSIFGKLLETRF